MNASLSHTGTLVYAAHAIAAANAGAALASSFQVLYADCVTYERDPGLDVRRPDLKGVRRTGTVRWWKEDKGYGRITADDGEILFVHFGGIEGSGLWSLEEGQRVSFVWERGIQDHGRHRAENVVPLDS